MGCIEQVKTTKHPPRGMGDSAWLVTNYDRRMLVSSKEDNNEIPNNGHSWFYYMDTDRYSWSASDSGLRLCKNTGRMGYYRRFLLSSAVCLESGKHSVPGTKGR